MRITGLASGLDIDSMVKQLMKAERVPLDKLNQQKQQTEWKRDGYRQVSTKLVSLNDKLTNLNYSSSVNAKKATVTGASNVITANATGAASDSVLNITVNNLATASNVVSSGVTVPNPSTTKISSIYGGTDTSITIGSSTISFSPDDTIDSLINKINSDRTAGVTAVYDASSGKISLTSKETGKKDITFSGDLLTNVFGLKQADVKQGVDASVTINGITTTQSSNSFTINGVEITLNGVTPSGQSSQVEVTQDIDKMVDTIKAFIDSYNETLALMNQKTGEERYRKFAPLTTEQKADMKDDEIKLWQEKAQSGMLKDDSILNKTISDMRSALISDVVLPNGQKINITEFGITTGTYSEKGKLVLDEKKLRAALEKNPEGASALFGQTDATATVSSNSKDGIFNRVKKITSVSLQSISDRAGTSRYSSDLTTAFLPKSEMGDQLKNLDDRIDAMNDRLTLIENRYYKQFTAMETAMNKYNSVSSSLTSMLS
ncbi:flagellar filament capping protein FliD [Paenibacillus sp. HJL G12]|uniref:Flagellar hook-associated protein 2 n=1 Tax=Paenibacillus dendrobii TaxID=2691084 RepID=A0A7X3LIX5_9BACL|nr:flagellar filament capping protein FliD [Paenibacillus dendrobii]MWV46612.1 flagellar filament capping protein FliD [Paenibacillus dendrobii]